MNVGEEVTLEVGGRNVVLAVAELKHILEHTRGSAAGRHKLGDVVALGLIVGPGLDVGLAVGTGWRFDTGSYGGG